MGRDRYEREFDVAIRVASAMTGMDGHFAVLESRLRRAVDDIDLDALGVLDAEVRRLVTSWVAAPNGGTSVALAELAGLYRELRVCCEAARDVLQQLLGDHHRTRAGLSAYRSSGATAANP